ncbi:hypothetical protein POKO110462_17900 [Pontibacter korlensis]|uniref:Uncharacterized protein n=1 Tax=Pontibacter korlensis TaxID=400092 RepID=A0A0E3UYF3_9BACT|nr:hypothetical protein [Pontibacter korlensis]AKD05067.1 hypothetical protein PKOR_20805 [Pontibacter korlensis]
MTVIRFPRKVYVHESKLEDSKGKLYFSSKEVDADDHTVKSGCMRGNDSYGKNGSASVGMSPVYNEPEHKPMSYNDFIHFNYGQPAQRQYDNPDGND